MSTNPVSLGYLMAIAQRSMLEHANEQRKSADDTADDAFRASIAKDLEAADADHAKAVNDYYVSNVESMGKVVPFLGDAIAGAVTSGKDDVWLAGPVYGGYGVMREGLRAEYAKAEANGEEAPAWGNPVTNTIVHADRTEAIANNDRATKAKIESKTLEKRSSDAEQQEQDATELRRQTLSDSRSMLEELRQAAASVSKLA
ncbi:hypothetical protein L6R52_42700 [Myxococcota bacterium]|nr:hypothetical protein [Myxococcota bacterium]